MVIQGHSRSCILGAVKRWQGTKQYWLHFLRFRRRSVRKPWKSTFSITPLLFDASSPRNPGEYPHKPYIVRNYSHCASDSTFYTRLCARYKLLYCIVLYCATSLLLRVWVIFIQLFVVGCENACILKQSAKWPFTVIQGHWFWYQSKPRVQLPISHQ